MDHNEQQPHSLHDGSLAGSVEGHSKNVAWRAGKQELEVTRIGAMYEAFEARKGRLKQLCTLLENAIGADPDNREKYWMQVIEHVEQWLQDADQTLSSLQRVLGHNVSPDQIDLENVSLQHSSDTDVLDPVSFAAQQLAEIMNIRKALAERRPQDVLSDLQTYLRKYETVTEKTALYAMEWLRLDPTQEPETDDTQQQATLQ